MKCPVCNIEYNSHTAYEDCYNSHFEPRPKQQVWVVTENEDGYGTTVHAVFSSCEKAEEFVDKYEKKYQLLPYECLMITGTEVLDEIPSDI